MPVPYVECETKGCKKPATVKDKNYRFLCSEHAKVEHLLRLS